MNEVRRAKKLEGRNVSPFIMNFSWNGFKVGCEWVRGWAAESQKAGKINNLVREIQILLESLSRSLQNVIGPTKAIKYLDISSLDIETSPRETEKCFHFPARWKILLLNWGYFYGFIAFAFFSADK